MACRRWANVGPTVKKPLAQRRQPTSDRRMCRRWANVGPTAECYLGTIPKWSKAKQDKSHIDTVPIPDLGRALVCPVAALQTLLHMSVKSRDSPFFQIHPGVPLTDSYARKHLKAISNFLKFRKNIFHDFRCGSATWAFRHGDPVEHIQLQGTWTSQCVWRYIQLPPSSSPLVSDAFRSFLHY